MRTRLVTVFLVPLLGVLLVLGGAYAWSAARSIQQEFFAERLGDLSYFVTSARQALRAGHAEVVQGEVTRFRQLYGTQVSILDRAGIAWVSSGSQPIVFEGSTADQVRLALSGRRGEVPQPVFPWSFQDAILVEPVFDDGDVIGAVVLSSSADPPRAEIVRHWVVLGALAVLATLIGFLVVNRLASWVLQPVRRVDSAMEAIEKGDMDARISDETGPPELRRMILIFNRMAEEIERVVLRQQEFALNASHELRNPLNALLVRVEYLATGLSSEWDEDVEAVREEGRRMVRILDTLLSLAKIGHGDSTFKHVDLVELIHRRSEAWSDVAARGGVSFELDGQRGVRLVTDEMVVEGALDAIIDNALKFSPEGTRILLSASEVEGGYSITVRDRGPGVGAEDLERITDRFWRSPESQNKPGSGLGLAIATDLLASINGRLRVVSPDDGGLEVTLFLDEDTPAIEEDA